MNEKLKEKLFALIKEKPANYGQCCGSKAYAELRKEILAATPKLLSDEFDFKTRIFWILHDMTDFPKCSVCGKPITRNVKTLQSGYNKSKEWEDGDLLNLACSDNAECWMKKKMRDAKQTCVEKYGVENVFQAKWCKDKITETCMRRSGCSRSGNSKSGREKAKATWKEHYGTDHPLKAESVKEKIRRTCMEKYGESSYTKTEEYREKTVRANLNRMLERIVVDAEVEYLNRSEFDKMSCVADVWSTPIKCRCKKCGTVFKKRLGINNYYKYGTVSSCPKCHPQASSSKPENDIFKFVGSILPREELIRNSRNVIPPYEIDIYVPSRKIAFEFDGLFWHSTKAGINKTYHLDKTEECERRGIRLVHIFENEWHFKQQIVKSRISNMLGVYDKTVYARKCAVKCVDSLMAKEFLDENHIQGHVNSRVNIGLYFENKLISLMTFSKPRFSKKYEWEMLRFCCRLGYHVPGAAGKLLKHFENAYKPKSLVSYADRRWSQGGLYAALGFKLDHKSKPDYWYWNYRKSGFILESRIKYQKHKLKDILEKFDPAKSEMENMKDNNFYQIFDCGNFVFKKDYA